MDQSRLRPTVRADRLFKLQFRLNRQLTTGLPTDLKAALERQSGLSLHDVSVVYNSAQPARINALAYTLGTEIHLAPGQVWCLPHEAWHVVQQKQGRVAATRLLKNHLPINDEAALEIEADYMGELAAQNSSRHTRSIKPPLRLNRAAAKVLQRCASFAEFVLSRHDKIKALRQAYIDDIKNAGTWGSEIEGRHLTEVFPIVICFWAKNHAGAYRKIKQYGRAGRILHILFDDNHLEAIKIIPVENVKINRADIQSNSGGGDCLYRAFHQAFFMSSTEPDADEIDSYRYYVADSIKQDGDLDFTGILTNLLIDFETWGIAIGAGESVNGLLQQYGLEYQSSLTIVHGGGSVPPKGFLQHSTHKIGLRDVVPRINLSRADRMIDRIGRLVATRASIHVAVALDGNVLVISCNKDTAHVLTAINNLVAYYGKGEAVNSDPMHGVIGEARVKKGVLGVSDTRRDKDIRKMEYLKSGKLMDISFVGDAQKLKRIKAALSAGLYLDNAEIRYANQEVGIYLIPHYTGSGGTVHGEMNVTNAIKKRRSTLDLTDNVYIGGTLIDCYDCNRAHKASNQKLISGGAKWTFYSGGTHGNSFPGWFLTPDIIGRLDVDTFKQERFVGNEHLFDIDEEYWDVYGRAPRPYGYYYLDSSGRSKIEWRSRPHTRPVTLRVNKNADAWFSEEGEQVFKRKKASQPDRTPHSFGDDSDSDTDDYDEYQKVSKKQTDSFASLDELFITPKISKAKKILQRYHSALDISRLLKPGMPDTAITLPSLSVLSPKLTFSPPKSSLSLTLVTASAKQNTHFHLLMPEQLAQLLDGLNRGGGQSWQLDPVILRLLIQSLQASSGSRADSANGLRSTRPMLQAPIAEEENQLLRIRLGSRDYLTKVRAVLSQLFIQAPESMQRSQPQLANQSGSAQLSKVEGPDGICLALVFDQFMALVAMTKQSIVFSGSLNQCLQQLALAKLKAMQLENRRTRQQQSMIDPESLMRFWAIYQALVIVFTLTGMGEWSLSALLDFVDSES